MPADPALIDQPNLEVLMVDLNPNHSQESPVGIGLDHAPHFGPGTDTAWYAFCRACAWRGTNQLYLIEAEMDQREHKCEVS